MYGLHIKLGAAVQYGELGAVDLDEHVVQPQGIESRHGMLDSAAAHLAFTQHRAALRVHNILGHGIHDGLPRHVHTLYLVAVVGGSRHESHWEVESGVQPLATERELPLECILL